MKRFLSYFLLLIVIPVCAAHPLDESSKKKIQIELGELVATTNRSHLCLHEEMGRFALLKQTAADIRKELAGILIKRNGGRNRRVFGNLEQSNLQATDQEERQAREEVWVCNNDIEERVSRGYVLEQQIQTYETRIKELREKLNN